MSERLTPDELSELPLRAVVKRELRSRTLIRPAERTTACYPASITRSRDTRTDHKMASSSYQRTT